MIRSAIIALFCVFIVSPAAVANSAAEQMWNGFYTAFELFHIDQQTTEDHQFYSEGYKSCFQSNYAATDYMCIQSVSELQWLVMKSESMDLTNQELRLLAQYKSNTLLCSDALDMKVLIGQCIDTALGFLAKPAISLLYIIKGRETPDFEGLKAFKKEFATYQNITPGAYARQIAPQQAISGSNE